MTFESIWLRMVEKKPLLVDPKATVEINTESFKAMLRDMYEKGRQAGKDEPSLFDSIFGTFGRKS